MGPKSTQRFPGAFLDPCQSRSSGARVLSVFGGVSRAFRWNPPFEVCGESDAACEALLGGRRSDAAQSPASGEHLARQRSHLASMNRDTAGPELSRCWSPSVGPSQRVKAFGLAIRCAATERTSRTLPSTVAIWADSKTLVVGVLSECRVAQPVSVSR